MSNRRRLRPALPLLPGFLVLLMTPPPAARPADKAPREPTPAEVRQGVRSFFAATARPDGSFRPGTDPDYQGLSDSAYSDLAPVTYAVVLHRTFGWELPHGAQTRAFLLGRQRPDGAFFNVKGTADPRSAQGQVYNTTQVLVALHALGARPRHDPLPVFAAVLRGDYKTLPAYSTSFFPLAYAACARKLPAEADRKLRATMTQADDGYLNDHIAATFHAVHYYRLLGVRTPQAGPMLRRVLRNQSPEGGWLLTPAPRDRHATVDAACVIHQLGRGRPESRRALGRAARWALRCRSPDGGFGHFPGSPSDADAV